MKLEMDEMDWFPIILGAIVLALILGVVGPCIEKNGVSQPRPYHEERG